MEIKNRARKVTIILLTLISICLILAVILIKTDAYLPCIFREITGYMCPGCGATRMCLAIIELDFKSAFNSNPILFITSPIILFLIYKSIQNYIAYGNMMLESKYEKIATFLVIIFILFGIVRNIL